MTITIDVRDGRRNAVVFLWRIWLVLRPNVSNQKTTSETNDHILSHMYQFSTSFSFLGAFAIFKIEKSDY
jgi:hypothetical protein